MLLNILSQLTIYLAVINGTAFLSFMILYICHEFFDTIPGLTPAVNKNSSAFFESILTSFFFAYGSFYATLGCSSSSGPFKTTPAIFI